MDFNAIDIYIYDSNNTLYTFLRWKKIKQRYLNFEWDGVIIIDF